MPRKAPDNVQEMRITFGTYERQFVTEIKNDIETAAKLTAVTAIGAPIVLGASVIGGFGLLGYGIYRGMDAFGSMSDVIETFGCALRNYTRSAIPFASYFVKSCTEVNAAPITPFNPDVPPSNQGGGGAPRGSDEPGGAYVPSDFEVPYGQNASDRNRTGTRT